MSSLWFGFKSCLTLMSDAAQGGVGGVVGGVGVGWQVLDGFHGQLT